MPPQTRRASHTVQLTETRQSFSLPCEVEPTVVELDPDAWVFMTARFTRR